MVRVRCGPKPPAGLATPSLLAHQAADSGPADRLPLVAQGLLDLLPQLPIRLLAGTLWPAQSVVETAPGDFETPAHPAHRKDFLMGLDQGVLHGACFAQYAAACFRLSRSSFKIDTSRRSRFSASSRGSAFTGS